MAVLQMTDWLASSARAVLSPRKVFRRLQRLLCPTPQQQIVNLFFRDKGDDTLRIDYPLNRDSLVIDLGGYRGDWAAQISGRYGCKLLIFEPVLEFAEQIRNRFRRNPEVRVYSFGLGARDDRLALSVSGDGSSVFGSAAKKQMIEIREVNEFFNAHSLDKVDLLKINIEGAEYELLERMLETSLVERVGDIQVQFHGFVPNALERMQTIQQRLGETHELSWQYPFLWENWRRRSYQP
jgi:FkbM family methyltransferase